MENFTQTSDEKLFLLCRQYGELALQYRHKFAGLLPEVYRRHLYKKKGFGSIFEFAAKLAGMSEEQVSRVLHLEEKFEKTPVLKAMLQNGEVSFHKLSRVASVATAENQDFWAQQVKILPQRALETLVRDAKILPQGNSDAQFVHVHTNLSQNSQNASSETWSGESNANSSVDGSRGNELEQLQLNSYVIQKLLELQQRGININELILEFLKKREIEIAQEKEKLSVDAKPTLSRYIPVSVRQLIKKEFGTKCSVEWCYKEAEEIHHTQRFSLSRRHDPKYLAPFCEEHHAIAHSIDQKYTAAKFRLEPT